MKIVECPRDAMQGIKDFIPTKLKTKYINTLLRVGFDTIDFGSFVSKAAVPQMKDVEKILDNLYISDTNTKLLAIVGNLRGTENLIKYNEISYIGFPFSVSETFLKLNINTNTQKSIERLYTIFDKSISYDKKVLVYLSMGFGNPYNDEWNIEILLDHIDILVDMGIEEINIADTIGIATPDMVFDVFSKAIEEYPSVEFGFHLHTVENQWYNKIESAYDAGVRKFDTAIGGHGGCPMTGYDLIGNVKTRNIIDFCFDKDINLNIDKEWLDKSIEISDTIFNKYK